MPSCELASDGAIREAMGAIFDVEGLVIEPAGVAGIAGLVEHTELLLGKSRTFCVGAT